MLTQAQHSALERSKSARKHVTNFINYVVYFRAPRIFVSDRQNRPELPLFEKFS